MSIKSGRGGGCWRIEVKVWLNARQMKLAWVQTHFEALLDWNEESVMTFGTENVLFLADDDSILEASDTMWTDIGERISVAEEAPCVRIVDFVCGIRAG